MVRHKDFQFEVSMKRSSLLLSLFMLLAVTSAMAQDSEQTSEAPEKFSVVLDKGRQSFSFSALTVREANLKCKDYADANIRDVFGELKVSSSSGKSIGKRATRWWKNRNELCSVVGEATLELGLPLGTPWRHLIQGLLQNSFEFVFYSNDKEEVRRQCQLFLVNRQAHAPFDVANFSYNFKKLKYVSTNSWWTEADRDFCQIIVDSLVD